MHVLLVIISFFKKRHNKIQNIIRNHICQINIHEIYKIISKVRIDQKKYELTKGTSLRQYELTN